MATPAETPVKFQLHFSTTNDAFKDDPVAESVRLLRAAADAIENHDLTIGRLRDSNGNRVGFYAFEYESNRGFVYPPEG